MIRTQLRQLQNPHSCCAEILGNESNFEVKGNIFYKSFTFTALGVNSTEMMDEATKNFCNEVLKNNTFKKENKIAVTYSDQWFYINEPIAE